MENTRYSVLGTWYFGASPGGFVSGGTGECRPLLQSPGQQPRRLAGYARPRPRDRHAGRVLLQTTLKAPRYAHYPFPLQGADAQTVPGTVLVDGFDVTPGAPIKL